MSNLQSWVERTDPVLFGHNGDGGIVNEYKTEHIERRALRRYIGWAVAGMAAFGGVPSTILILQLLHWIPK